MSRAIQKGAPTARTRYHLRVITDRAMATPGALRVGPVDDPERWQFGSYGHYWSEVEMVEDRDQLAGVGGSHRERLRRYEQEAADSPPSLQVYRDGRVVEHREYIAMLEVTPSLAAAKYDALHEEGIVLEGFNSHDGRTLISKCTPASAHITAREQR